MAAESVKLMGRKPKSKQQPGGTQVVSSVSTPPPDMASWMLSLPRLIRIILIALPAMATTVIFVPVVDAIYLRYFYSDSTRMLPSIIEAAIALTVYLIGWILVVGTSGEKPEDRRAVRWYMTASFMLMALASMYLAALLLSVRE
jgi:hypothetical protein